MTGVQTCALPIFKRVAPYVSVVEKQARTVDIEANFDKPEDAGKLLVGYSADIEVILAVRDDVVRVPTSALLEGEAWRQDLLAVLRANRDRLQKAMDDTSTPANALPAISRQLIDVCERIESLQGGGLTDLLDDEEDEVTDDVGASIV